MVARYLDPVCRIPKLCVFRIIQLKGLKHMRLAVYPGCKRKFIIKRRRQGFG